MTTKYWHYAGVTGRTIEDAIANLKRAGWAYMGLDIADGITVHVFEWSGGSYWVNGSYCPNFGDRELCVTVSDDGLVSFVTESDIG